MKEGERQLKDGWVHKSPNTKSSQWAGAHISLPSLLLNESIHFTINKRKKKLKLGHSINYYIRIYRLIYLLGKWWIMSWNKILEKNNYVNKNSHFHSKKNVKAMIVRIPSSFLFNLLLPINVMKFNFKWHWFFTWNNYFYL